MTHFIVQQTFDTSLIEGQHWLSIELAKRLSGSEPLNGSQNERDGYSVVLDAVHLSLFILVLVCAFPSSCRLPVSCCIRHGDRHNLSHFTRSVYTIFVPLNHCLRKWLLHLVNQFPYRLAWSVFRCLTARI